MRTEPCVCRTGNMLTRRRFTGQTFTLRVGANAGAVEEFSVHEVVLKETSGFFQAAVKKEWKEGSQRIIDMPEDTPEVVSVYVDWLYSDRIYPKTGELPVDAGTHGAESEHLAKLYVFGEKIQDDCFCDAVVTALTKHIDRKTSSGRFGPSNEAVKVMMEGTARNSPGRRLMLELLAKCVSGQWIQVNRGSFEAIPGLLADLVVEIMGIRDAHTNMPDVFPQRKKWFKKK